MVKINGLIAFRNKKEKLKAFKELKQEFGDNVTILFLDHFIEYSCYVPRTYI